jgi:hypothetical protein
MNKSIAIGIGIVLATGFLITAIVPEKVEGATERTWLSLGTSYSVTTGYYSGYLKVNSSDLVTVNIVSVNGNPTTHAYFFTNGIAMNYTGTEYDSSITLYYSYTIGTTGYNGLVYGYDWEYTQTLSSGQSAWITSSTDDAIFVVVTNTAQSGTPTFNITITPDPAWESLNSKINNINSTVAGLNFTISTLNSTINNLNASITNLTESLLTNLSRINASLTDIQAYAAYLNGSVSNLTQSFLANLSIVNGALYDLNVTIQELRDYTEELNLSLWENLTVDLANVWTELVNLNMSEQIDITNMKAQIVAVNASLTQVIEQLQSLFGTNDTILLGKLTELSGLMGIMNSTLNDRISNIPRYNDTTVWDEIGRLKKGLSEVSLNNTNLTTLVNQIMVNQTLLNQTLINQTLVNRTEVNPTTYVNTTKTSNEGVVIGATVGVITGVASGLGSSMIFHRRRSGYRPELK